ncbi:MAG: tyrosine-type recombinase/integrase [Crocinitomicaceae bacterium]|nr:tyrosine-type recombinase/integrase [Crocinitomicaceae bacterium]
MLDKFISYLQFEKRYSEHTVIAYKNDLSQFITFAELQEISDFSSLRPTFIRSWIVELIENGCANKSVNRKLASLRTFYKWLRKEGLASTNPLLKLRGPKSEKRLPSFAKESELKETNLSDYFSDDFNGLRDALMVEVFYQTGIRLSELINLKDGNVTNDSIKVLGKRNKERIIPITAALYKKIAAYRKVRNLTCGATTTLFVLENGNILYPAFVYRRITKYLGTTTQLDKKSPHVLRHTFATHMLNRGAGLETLKDLLGHANLAATQIYTHNSFAQLTKVYSQAHPRGK